MRASLRETRCRGVEALSPLLLSSLMLLLPLTLSAAAEGPPAQPASAAAEAPDAPDGQLDPELLEAEAAWLREADTALLAGQLARLLRRGDGNAAAGAQANAPGEWSGPVLLFDNPAADNDQLLLGADASVGKRSRYYRRYPWKRQPGRGGGTSAIADIDNPYLCNPTREDVFQLLVALHEARAGNLGRTVSFCNRRRPAAAVFTNIRFLGRRRRR